MHVTKQNFQRNERGLQQPLRSFIKDVLFYNFLFYGFINLRFTHQVVKDKVRKNTRMSPRNLFFLGASEHEINVRSDSAKLVFPLKLL